MQEDYGGVFTNRPFEINPKCIVVAGAAAAAYWFLPAKKNPVMMIVIFIVVYICLSWYDYFYNCDAHLRSGKFGLDAIFKPQLRDKDLPNSAENQEQIYAKRVNWFHIIAVMPLLVYIGYKGVNSHKNLFPILAVVGAAAGLYHGVRLLIPRETK